MSKGLAFWIIMLILLVFGIWTGYAVPVVAGGYVHYYLGMTAVTYVLLFLLGWQVFGFPIQ
jgi:hypothetical protein